MKKQLKNKRVEITLSDGHEVVVLGKEALDGQCYTQIPAITSRKCAIEVEQKLYYLTSKRLIMNSLSTQRDRGFSDDEPYIFEIKTSRDAKRLEPEYIRTMCEIGREPELPRADIVIADARKYSIAVFAKTAATFVLTSKNSDKVAMGVLIRSAITKKHFLRTMASMIYAIGGKEFTLSLLTYSGYNYPDGKLVLPRIKEVIKELKAIANIQLDVGYDVSLPSDVLFNGTDLEGNNVILLS